MKRRARSGVLGEEGRPRRRRAVLGIAGATIGLLVLPARTAFASHEPLKHVKGTFPSHGFIWLDHLYNAANELFVSSDRCKPAEASAWNTIRSQLAGGAAEFRGAWSGGITFSAYSCSGTVNNFVDILLDYMSSSQWTSAGHGSYGGHHHYSLGSSAWCGVWGVPYPCGYHISRLHINEPRFDGYSSSYKVSFLLHETGHSMGFYDYCGHTSAANNGASCALRGAWFSVDKKMLRDVVYKNSPVR